MWAAFANVGPVLDVVLPRDRETGQPRGFAFVTMLSEEIAEKAIEKLDGFMLEGRPLRVNEAQERIPAQVNDGRNLSYGGRGAGGGGGVAVGSVAVEVGPVAVVVDGAVRSA